MTYDGNGYAILDRTQHMIAWQAEGCPVDDDGLPSRVELAELAVWDAWARREARHG